ncbi:MAG: Holliday junction branch migration protein RuvA [Bdellovibrio sp. CG12_big_fil_rev_8_21_14_0_65_39_13]|nr:MAG: Holliday junction branch migration protein RuvA [Bdellovibrio sp. CG22_combo_CG10-13_8_21_14_all_39_27]PIQ60646.1 MAG: Holliday junction branch migration protein RuvA [Bdellovibrio sp. CG12_big_fil_rev_8_21_14_0_65_39_13]PIR37030.1 MAG: Holliday junction branch migration protein RuvA [Bdellovibrio sp. CG11_big_fil_rev_8_21_14_0_20_39_38]PJB52445.1 MAG: Holliday junction branch migration protein RuvA [Bdellovibrio sp. CG_4_9_14_3_um_filter_39_7]
MIGYLEGTVLSSDGHETIIKNNAGVGYQVYYKQIVTIGHQTQVYVSSIFREDGQFLYGFSTLQEKKFFELLLKVKGIGPKTAYNLMTQIGPEQISLAVRTDSKSALSKVPGVGAKAAAQIILDLTGKLDHIEIGTELNKTSARPQLTDTSKQLFQDTVLALKELGYKETEFNQIVLDKLKEQTYQQPEKLLQDVLRSL